MAAMSAAAALFGGAAAGLWWWDRSAASSERSAAGNVSMAEQVYGADWWQDLNGRGAAYKPMLMTSEDRHGIPRWLLARLAWQESRFRTDIISGATASHAGALGIMQIVPRWHPTISRADILNPPVAIDYAAGYLAQLARQFGAWELALMAYNWGPGNVRKWQAGQKTMPAETDRYRKQILADWQAFTGSSIV